MKPGDDDMPMAIQAVSNSKAMYRIGWGMSGLVILFMLFDGISKVMLVTQVVEATNKIGYPGSVIRPIGIILLLCTVLYAVPRTAIIGAILLTGFLGGAVASKVRLEDPLFGSVLFGVYFGILVWGGLYFRDQRVRSLIPLRRPATLSTSADSAD
jgi:hypothetical protein